MPSSKATAGRARSSMPTAEGMMSARTARRPPDSRCRKAARCPGRPALGEVGRDHRHHRDRDDAVGQLEEGVGVGVRRDRVGPGHAAGQHGDDEERHLVGHHEAEGPAAQPGDGPQRLVARVPVPAQQAEIGPAQARHERHALEHHAERGAEAEQHELAPVRVHAGEGGTVAGPQAEPDQDGDADDVVDDGRPGHGHELAPGVEERRAQREEAVGGDLDHEPAQEPGGHLALEQHAVQLAGVPHGYRARSARR